MLAALVLSAVLPVVGLDHDRAIRDDPKVPATLTVDGTRHRAGVELRGQSSQTFAKKSYAVELRGEDAALLGMPAEDDWVLTASHADKTLVRNVVAYETAARLGGWAPRTRLVELRRNGRPAGVYVLGERPELGRERVDAAWLVELTFPFQARTKGARFTLPITRRPVVFDDPERGDLGTRRARAVRDAVVRAERALHRGGWRRHLDARSAVDFVLLNELFKNVDAFHASTYLHKPRDGRLRLGPVWDLDLSAGNSTCCASARTSGFITRDRDLADRLWADRAFRAQLARRWRALRADGLREAVLGSVDRHAAALRDSGAAGRNFDRWPVLSRRVFQEPVLRGSYDAEVRFLRTWLERRIAWLDRQWRGARGR